MASRPILELAELPEPARRVRLAWSRRLARLAQRRQHAARRRRKQMRRIARCLGEQAVDAQTRHCPEAPVEVNAPLSQKGTACAARVRWGTDAGCAAPSA